MALLRNLLVLPVCLLAVTAYGHSMGRSVPVGFAGEGPARLVAQAVASYFEEQMGRETRIVPGDTPSHCVGSVRDRDLPLALVPAQAADNLPEGVVRVGEAFGPPGSGFVLIMGAEAMQRLEFSLVPRYLEKLSGTLKPVHWRKAVRSMEEGEGVRGVALRMLREADLM